MYFFLFALESVRKYFATTLYKVGLPQLSIDWFLGHKIEKTTAAYFKMDTESLKNQYIKCIKDLLIEQLEIKTLDSEDKKRLSELESKYEELLKIVNDKNEYHELP